MRLTRVNAPPLGTRSLELHSEEASGIGARLMRVRPGTVVKIARIVIVVLLSLVLPLRGALGATSWCEVDAFGTHPAQTQGMEAQRSPDHGDHVGASHTHQHHTGHGHDGVQHIVKCATSCTVAPVSVDEAHLMGAPAHETVEFPLYAEPVASFITAGPERPPRTL